MIQNILEAVKEDIESRDLPGLSPVLLAVLVDDEDNVSTTPHILDVTHVDELYPLMESIVVGYADAREAIIMLIFAAVSDLEAMTIEGESHMLFGFLVRAMTIDALPVWGFLPLQKDENGMLRLTENPGFVIAQELEDDAENNMIHDLVLTYARRYRKAILRDRKRILH